MQSNPVLTILKILAFAALAFLVGVVSCQRASIEDRMARLEAGQANVATRLDEVGRAIREGGGVQGVRTAARREDPERRNAELDTAPDPSRKLGTPGRYKNFLRPDPDPEVPSEAEGKDKGRIGWWYGTDVKGFNFVTENAADLTEDLEIYVAGLPAQRHWANPSLWRPDVCWRVEVSPDYREYTLFLRDDVVWHQPLVDLTKYPHLAGRHLVTAADLKFTYDIIRNSQHEGSSLRGYYVDIESVEAVDSHTVVVRWKETMFHSISFTLGVTIMPEFLFAFGADGKRFSEDTIGTEFNNHFYNSMGVCGCGPYRLVEYRPGESMRIERFEDWHRARDGVRYPLREIRLFIFPDPETNLNKFKAEEITVTGLSAPQWKSEVLDNKDSSSPFVDGRIEKRIARRPQFAYFGWKNTHALFRDKRVRKALALACNVPEICDKIFLGRFRPMASPVYDGSPEADPDLSPLPFDLDAARALLDEAGWKMNESTGLREKEVDGSLKEFRFTLLWPGPAPDFEAALNHYKNDLLRIGVRLEPQSMQWAVFQKRIHDRDFEAITLLWSTSGWEHDFDQIWHSRQIQEPGSSNMIEFRHPEVDRLSDELRREMDLQKRIEKVRTIGRILYEEQPYCFFAWRNVFLVNWSYLKNVEHEYRFRPIIRFFPFWDSR